MGSRNLNLASCLLGRESGMRVFKPNSMQADSARFSNFSLERKIDLWKLSELYDFPTCAKEMLSRDGILLVLLTSRVDTTDGYAIAISLETGNLICCLNDDDEHIQNVFYNRSNDSLIVTYVLESEEGPKALRCKTYPFENLRVGRLDEPVFISFGDIELKNPSFVEFDDTNGSIVTWCHEKKLCQVWNLADYKLMFCITGVTHEFIVKIGVGCLFIFRLKCLREDQKPNRYTMEGYVHCIKTGKLVRSLSFTLPYSDQIELVELFLDKLFVKQHSRPLYITDIGTMQTTSVESFPRPLALMFLQSRDIVLVFSPGSIGVWSTKGESICQIENRALSAEQKPTSNIVCATADQRIILSLTSVPGSPGPCISAASVVSGEHVGLMQGPKADVLCMCYDEGSQQLCVSSSDASILVLSS